MLVFAAGRSSAVPDRTPWLIGNRDCQGTHAEHGEERSDFLHMVLTPQLGDLQGEISMTSAALVERDSFAWLAGPVFR